MSVRTIAPDSTAAGRLVEGLRLIEVDAFEDDRGWFSERWNARAFAENGIDTVFVQDNTSWSRKGVLRGLHFQREPHVQAKLVGVLDGSVFDVAVDIRKGSPTFGEWFGCELSRENHRQLFIPAGFAHGFLVLSDSALVCYKCSAYYSPQADGGVRWDDPDIAVAWPLAPTVVSAKDRAAPLLRDL